MVGNLWRSAREEGACSLMDHSAATAFPLVYECAMTSSLVILPPVDVVMKFCAIYVVQLMYVHVVILIPYF